MRLQLGTSRGIQSPQADDRGSLRVTITDPLLVEGVEGVSSLGRGGFPPPIAEPGLDVAVLIPHGLHRGS